MLFPVVAALIYIPTNSGGGSPFRGDGVSVASVSCVPSPGLALGDSVAASVGGAQAEGASLCDRKHAPGLSSLPLIRPRLRWSR